MKRITAVGIAIALLSSTGAQASVATLLVKNGAAADPVGIFGAGAMHYDEVFNVTFNPSVVAGVKNVAHIETLQHGGAFFGLGESMTLGAYLGFKGDIKGSYSVAGASNGNMQPIELILAGTSSDMKWGVTVQNARYNATADTSANETVLKVGGQVAGFEPFVNMTLSGKDKTSATAETKYSTLIAGTRYHYEDWTPFAVVRKDTITASAGTETKDTRYGLGFGHTIKAADKSQVNYGLSFWRNLANSGTTYGRTVMPLNLSYESEIASWLTGRVGMKYNVMDKTADTDAAGSTTATVGGTMKFGKASMDFVIGSGDGATNQVSGGGTTTGQFIDFSHGLFSYASITYAW